MNLENLKTYCFERNGERQFFYHCGDIDRKLVEEAARPPVWPNMSQILEGINWRVERASPRIPLVDRLDVHMEGHYPLTVGLVIRKMVYHPPAKSIDAIAADLVEMEKKVLRSSTSETAKLLANRWVQEGTTLVLEFAAYDVDPARSTVRVLEAYTTDYRGAAIYWSAYSARKRVVFYFKFDPLTGQSHPWPSDPEAYKAEHGDAEWQFDPYTGQALTKEENEH